MLLDHSLVVSDAQAFSADIISTNIIDLLVTGQKIGAGEPMALVVFVDVAADHTTGDETYAFKVYTDDDVAFGSPTTLKTETVLYSAMTQYAAVVIFIDPSWTFERYAAVYFDGGGTTPTVTGTIALMPVSAIRKFTTYANAYTITH